MPTLSDELTSLDGLDLLDREDLIAMVKRMVNGGVSLSFNGKHTVMEITRKVRPRVTRLLKDLHVGGPEDQCKNLLIEGENLRAMVTLYKYRGQVDLIVTDPPYNTGQYFRYNDRWDEDPNDPDLGSLVTTDDGPRHTKWIKVMFVRLQTIDAEAARGVLRQLRQDGGRGLQGRWHRQTHLLHLPRSTERSGVSTPHGQLERFEGLGKNSLLRDMNGESHSPMSSSTEHRTVTDKISRFGGGEGKLGRLFLFDFGIQIHILKFESMSYILRGQFKHHRFTLLHSYFRRFVAKPFGSDIDLMWPVSGGCKAGES
jgi:hypothetical protein